ncbi:homocysteine-responsive endoplasmic reticulum-resident ubiquitin-like domain member 2 protein [Nephila pilipes]|uniref:Homocysteine-responsive endoplasmic reticulum-resident ubiquitin-like domain member 2 protein n=1 Tax=Nephila pilipes TaxID=299642 RepID=A0A8X6UKD7_NEPPI|nr:homocysteine-responsive endoplasmic reticulum-resident ubiquitin-like domain member 2 protein [Nephila pilipes]
MFALNSETHIRINTATHLTFNKSFYCVEIRIKRIQVFLPEIKKMSLQLIIKSATQSVEDFTLPCEITWTIAQVKDQLSTLYPTNPKKDHQKLIYGGRLLPDHISLKSVLNQSQEVHIVHLVCSSPNAYDTEKTSPKKEQSTPPVYTASPPPPNSNGIYPQMNNQVLTSDLSSGLPGATWSSVYNTASNPTQQYMAMQQMYMQMMSQYYAQFNGSIPYGPFLANPPPVQPPSTPASRPNVPQNAPDRQAEEEERDYIDYLYILSRLAILFAILFYYSSPARIIGVLAMAVLISFFAKMNRQHRREEVQRANENPNASTEQAQSDNQASENEQVPESSVGTESAADTESTAPENQNESQSATSVPSTIFTLVTAFFSSLIPSDPLPVNVN